MVATVRVATSQGATSVCHGFFVFRASFKHMLFGTFFSRISSHIGCAFPAKTSKFLGSEGSCPLGMTEEQKSKAPGMSLRRRNALL